ncbi:hypothetical protein GNI_185080 [Gregarina niphandrodes]|uniref:Uncharacterized protein n=1 Tax=Gregarina niphandrodes TaxID=110365 RepID=A0A023AXY5_GRENI|nr:hypothetical protein GNI_185080 [Gregarina niphandrodes]EZG43145.1 hypothetical protein GNI_185080 [Gregarina niphandrodes]|eukprot:XP_011133599.1 hypothetical protein GNI_185080 [Gregarina niphandrodes]
MAVGVDQLIKENQAALADIAKSQQQLRDNAAAGDTKLLSDVNQAIQVMKKLNPHCQDDNVLLKVLQAHVAGSALDLTAAEAAASASAPPILVPVEPVGFQVSHVFAFRDSRGSRELRAVRLLESPEILAVHELLDATQAAHVCALAAALPFRAGVCTYMKAKVERVVQYTVPNDAGDIDISVTEVNETRRRCRAAPVPADSSLFRLLQVKAAAVCRLPTDRIQHITIERYAAGDFTKQGHFSHSRAGAVLIALNDGKAEASMKPPQGDPKMAEPKAPCGIVFQAASINVMPLPGMALFIPSVCPDTLPSASTSSGENGSGENSSGKNGSGENGSGKNTSSNTPVPDLRTEFSIAFPEGTVDKPVYYVVAYVDLPLVEPEH